jgi:alanine-synthesizing transaminase
VTSSFSSRLPWPAPANALARARAELAAAGRRVIDLSVSNPTRVGLEAARPEPDWPLGLFLDRASLRYEPDPRGLQRAREALAARYASDAREGEPSREGAASRGTAAARHAPGAEDIFLCASTSEAYGWLFKLLCDPGDAVLVPKPGYPLFDYLAGLESVEARPYRLEYAHPSGWRVDLHSVERALAAGRAKAVVLINPNNPTGSYVRAEERSGILSMCARYGCAVVSDEVFFGFPVEGGERSSLVGEESVLTFALDGLSKRLGLPQMKLGWIAASGPRRLLDEARGRLEIVADTYLSAGAPVMNALPRLLEAEADFAGALGRRLAANLAALRGILEGPGSPHRVLRCSGGWTALVESPALASEEELSLSLLREGGLWSQPGFLFDMEREAFFTMSLILPPEILEEGARAYLRRFEELMRY